MRRLLASRRVHLLSFEYAMGWHPLFSKREPLTAEERHRSHYRSLHRFQRELSGYGYDTYLINAGAKTSGVISAAHAIAARAGCVGVSSDGDDCSRARRLNFTRVRHSHSNSHTHSTGSS